MNIDSDSVRKIVIKSKISFMIRYLSVSVLILLTASLNGQEEKNYGIKWSGFVKTDFFYDSRQSISAREGHFLLWPMPEKLDSYGDDVNASSSFNILSVQSRLTASLSGPDAFGASTSGVIEADFFAQANDNINLLRLRHAYLKMAWSQIELLAGQYWNPLFITDCFPATVSFNTGAPLSSFARNPQIRVTYQSGNLYLVGAALGQRDYATAGMAGTTGTYLRNSGMPDMHLQAHIKGKGDGRITGYATGVAVAYKKVVPRLENSGGFPAYSFVVDEKVNGVTLMAFSKITTEPVTLKMEVRYGENISDLMSISGFAVKEITNPITGESDYTPLKSFTLWGELHTNGPVQLGIFGGYLLNMGTRDPMSDAGNNVYGLGTNIRSLLRLSPRLIFNSGSTRIAFEVEYTSALYGSDYDMNYIPSETTGVSNLRALAALYYFF